MSKTNELDIDDLKPGVDPLDDLPPLDDDPDGGEGQDGSGDGAAQDGEEGEGEGKGDSSGNPEGEDAAEELAALERVAGAGSVPIARLNEVLAKQNEYSQQLTLAMARAQQAEERLRELEAGVAVKPKEEETAPRVDRKALAIEHAEALLEGETEKAAEILLKLQESLMAEAADKASSAADRRISEQTETQRIEAVAEQVFTEFPELNKEAEGFDQDKWEVFEDARNSAVMQGKSVSAALEHALGRLQKVYGGAKAAAAATKASAATRGVSTLEDRVRMARQIPPSIAKAGAGAAAGDADAIDRIARLPVEKQKAAWERHYGLRPTGMRDPLED